MSNRQTCPICKTEYSESIDPWECSLINKRGKCKECIVKEKGLIKVGTHYVPWDYQNSIEFEGQEASKDAEYYEDVNASLPRISWDEHYKKWKLEFTGADFGGYDCQNFVWYFDTKEDIINAMLS